MTPKSVEIASSLTLLAMTTGEGRLAMTKGGGLAMTTGRVF